MFDDVKHKILENIPSFLHLFHYYHSGYVCGVAIANRNYIFFFSILLVYECEMRLQPALARAKWKRISLAAFAIQFYDLISYIYIIVLSEPPFLISFWSHVIPFGRTGWCWCHVSSLNSNMIKWCVLRAQRKCVEWCSLVTRLQTPGPTWQKRWKIGLGKETL